jgi:hypothetical protein
MKLYSLAMGWVAKVSSQEHVAGREGRQPNGAFLPVCEFGLRISVHNIGEVAIRKSCYDPVKEIAQNRILRLRHVNQISLVRETKHVTTQATVERNQGE